MQISETPLETALGARERAASWFVRSSIQGHTGGVSRYYRGDSGVRLRDSAEITGYAVRAFLSLPEPGPAYRAGRYLLDSWKPDLETIPFEPGAERELAYFFDLGIIARAFLALFADSGDRLWRDAAWRAAGSMARDFESGGGYHPVVALPEKRPLEYTGWWSRRPGAFQLKAALAWLDTGREDCYERQLEFALRTHRELLEKDDLIEGMDCLHPYCYFLEGLLPRAARFREIFRQGISEVALRLRRIDRLFARSDVYAQLLRLRLLADREGLCPLDESAARWEFDRLLDFQLSSGDPRLDGAFAFGRRDGVPIPHANPVSTAFACQAIDWYRAVDEARFSSGWRDLI